VFGHTFVSSLYLTFRRQVQCFQTDHMLTIPWDVVTGWGTPRIGPCKPMLFFHTSHLQTPNTDGPLALEPSSTVLHYAQTLFEGMKAYRQDDGKVTLFRPDMNMKRMNNSARRIALPVIAQVIHSIAPWLIIGHRPSTEVLSSNSLRSLSSWIGTGYQRSRATAYIFDRH
jgi:hypothetical protein